MWSPWNFGPAHGSTYSVQEITEKLIETLGVAMEWGGCKCRTLKSLFT